jgi:hypothetical protein
MSSNSQNILHDFLINLETEKIPKEIVEKLQTLLSSESDVNDKDIISLIEESVLRIDNN